jgi:hypothetical protein
MSNGETLFSVSQTLYGTQDYWWLIAVINGIYDIYFDIALSNTVIQEIADDELSDGYSASDLLLKYDELTAENDDKRVIKVINPPDIKRVILTILKAK